ncbi:MAG: UDP-3-O-(3-hydroxymyristoyl)glucosamine N-acyltransferase [Deltaproteobacteria bacterium]|nr:UDP-3-O-(3-hydroxymyristoyl)glucosamine N-acyltransferase [Deltaproteobacteria bacterium]
MEISLERIAEVVGGKIVVGDENTLISGIASLESATPSDISFFFDRRYKKFLQECGAGALLVSQQDAEFAGPQVVVTNPQLAYARVATLFSPPLRRHPGISRRAYVNDACRFGENVSVSPGVYVGPGVEIGDESTLFPGVYIGERVKIGKRTLIYPNVTIFRDCVVGDDVIIHAGTVIGSDGFGFVRDGDESVKIPQNGWVHIEDRVEIGANNCIDRAALGKTWIKRGTKTDNLVHIAHNVVVGEDTIIVAQVGVSGSCTIGRNVVIGGQVGIIDHIDVGDRVMIGPQSGISKSIPEGQVVTGSPAIPHRQFLKSSAMTARLPQFLNRLKALEKKVAALEKEDKME